jgi:glycosyltransferase involved in cell wall biosynthesis
MVAIFANVKRHWLLFKAIKNLSNDLKTVCVGIPYKGRSVETLQKEAEEYGVGDRLTFIVRPTQKELRILLQRAKVFCALTHEEGSFIAVAESLMSGTPVIAFKNAYFGTKGLINSSNGRLVRSVKGLRRAISDLGKIDNDQIRINSRKNFSSSVNCRKLNGILKQNANFEKNQWCKDIEPFYCVRQKLYYEQTDSYHCTKKDYQWLKQNGINVEQVVMEENKP